MTSDEEPAYVTVTGRFSWDCHRRPPAGQQEGPSDEDALIRYRKRLLQLGRPHLNPTVYSCEELPGPGPRPRDPATLARLVDGSGIAWTTRAEEPGQQDPAEPFVRLGRQRGHSGGAWGREVPSAHPRSQIGSAMT